MQNLGEDGHSERLPSDGNLYIISMAAGLCLGKGMAVRSFISPGGSYTLPLHTCYPGGQLAHVEI